VYCVLVGMNTTQHLVIVLVMSFYVYGFLVTLSVTCPFYLGLTGESGSHIVLLTTRIVSVYYIEDIAIKVLPNLAS